MNLTPEIAEAAASVMGLEQAKGIVDRYNEQRTERLSLQKEVEKLEAAEKELKKQLIDLLKTAGASSVGGKTAIVRLIVKNEPSVKDWDSLYAHIRATGEFELLYRRANPAPIKERKDVGVDVPGIEWFPVESLSLSQIK